MIAASGCKLCAVLLTHGHYDHILAAEEVCKRHNVQVYVSEDEKELLHSPQMNLSQGYGRSTVLDADVYIRTERIYLLRDWILKSFTHRDILRAEAAIISQKRAFCFQEIRCLQHLSAEPIFRPAA